MALRRTYRVWVHSTFVADDPDHVAAQMLAYLHHDAAFLDYRVTTDGRRGSVTLTPLTFTLTPTGREGPMGGIRHLHSAGDSDGVPEPAGSADGDRHVYHVTAEATFTATSDEDAVRQMVLALLADPTIAR
jgi:hypothetical protein